MEATYLRDDCIEHSQEAAKTNVHNRKQNENDLTDIKTQIYHEKIPPSVLERMGGKCEACRPFVCICDLCACMGASVFQCVSDSVRACVNEISGLKCRTGKKLPKL